MERKQGEREGVLKGRNVGCRYFFWIDLSKKRDEGKPILKLNERECGGERKGYEENYLGRNISSPNIYLAISH